jgi:hypothetical protein
VRLRGALALSAKPGHAHRHAGSRDERHKGRFPLPLARLSFDYEGEIVAVESGADAVIGASFAPVLRTGAVGPRNASLIRGRA